MRTFAILSLIAAVVCAENTKPRDYYEKLFFEHMQKFQLKFKDGAEFVHRLKIFADNMDMIEKHNADPTQTYKMGQNQFTHLTFAEFKEAVHLGAVSPRNLRRGSEEVHQAPQDVTTLPASVDWVSAGAVTPVKNQGNCGSCWSFSTTGAIEGAYFIKHGSLLSYSEQMLVDCDTTCSGCNGGWMDTAFTWTKSRGGLTTEDQYPYTSGTTTVAGTCKTSGYSLVSGTAPTSYTDVTPGSISALMSAVAKQPVSIAIEADQVAFQSYSTGVLTSKCGQNLDHGVLLVGYGTLNGVDYWKVKNSWGPSWGMEGYILIERSSADLCGVLDAPSYPNL